MEKETFQLNEFELNDSRVYRDPIHNYIHVNHLLIWHLINTKEMQRLRRIKQLGGTFQVYQTAEHSRFTHSLGVYEIVRRMIEETEIKRYLNDYDKATVLCAGLLHDLGHGPFSHSFEQVFHTKHEKITVDIILKDSEVHDVLSRYHPDLPKDVASVIEKKHPNKILVQMISSQIDADRMDYLLRDSYFTGTTYGQFDLGRLLRSIRIVNHQIVFKYSGVQAIEDYILARYHMYWQVYYHPTARSFEQLLIQVFRRAQDLYKDGFDFGCDLRYLWPFLKNHWDHKDYFNLDETVIQYYFRCFSDASDAILSDLASRFLNRHLLKHQDYQDIHEVEALKTLALENGFDPQYYIITDNQKQIPYKHYGANGNIEDIKILMPDKKEIKDLPEVSEIVDAIVRSKRNKVDKKVYYPKEIKKIKGPFD